LIVNYLYTQSSQTFVGLTVSKRMGNAVKRNYIKRVLRSALRNNTSLITKNISIEIIPKKNLEKRRFSQIEKDLSLIIKKLYI